MAGTEWVRRREGGGEGKEGMGQIVQGLGNQGEDLGFYHNEWEP